MFQPQFHYDFWNILGLTRNQHVSSITKKIQSISVLTVQHCTAFSVCDEPFYNFHSIERSHFWTRWIWSNYSYLDFSQSFWISVYFYCLNLWRKKNISKVLSRNWRVELGLYRSLVVMEMMGHLVRTKCCMNWIPWRNFSTVGDVSVAN